MYIKVHTEQWSVRNLEFNRFKMDQDIVLITRETYEKSSLRELKMILVLTKLLKTMHTSWFIFLCSLAVTLIPASLMYFGQLKSVQNGWTIFLFAFLFQLIIHVPFTMNILFHDARETVREQEQIQVGIEELLREKVLS